MKPKSSAEKAAIVIASLGEDLAATIFSHLNQSEIKRIATALNRLKKVDQDTSDEVLREFQELLQSSQSVKKDGRQFTNEVLGKAFGANSEALMRQLGLDKPPGLPALQIMEPATIASFLKAEHPQTVALILAHLEARKFKDALKLLPESIHTEVLIRIARLEPVSPETLYELNEALQSYAEKSNLSAHSQVGGSDKVAKLLNALGADQRATILEQLAERDPRAAEEIQSKMFTFLDLNRLDNQGMQTLIKHVDQKSILLALKTASEAFKTLLFANMSSRAAELLQDDFSSLGKVRKSDVESAQKQIADTAKALIDSGEITLIDEGEYVA